MALISGRAPLGSPPADRRVAWVTVLDHGALSLRPVALPPRHPGEIDVDISSAAICGSDLHTVLGHRAAPDLVALGHEGVGVITDLDDGTTDACGLRLERGDKIVMSMISSCGRCDRCLSGLSMKCRQLQKYGHDSVSRAPYATGMLADRVRLTPGVAVVRVDTDSDDALLVSAGCAGATAAAVVRAADPAAGRTALVIGAGAVGFFSAAMLATAGCEVVVRDPSSRRLALLDRTGAVADPGERGEFSIVVEASGNPNAFTEAITAAEIGGHVVAAGSVSLGATSVELDPAQLVTRRLRLTGVHNYTTSDFIGAVDWLRTHGENAGVRRLTSAPIPLPEIQRAFDAMMRGEFARVLVSPSAGSRPAER